MAFHVFAAGEFDPESPLTTGFFSDMIGNFAGLAAGDTGHPEIVQAAMADNSIGQAQLKDSTGSQSVAVGATSSGTLALTGSDFSMFTISADNAIGSDSMGLGAGNTAAGTLGFRNSDASSRTVYVDTRYFTASKPYATDDGPIPLFVCVEIELGTGNPLSVSVAPDPTWAYHGPTSIKASRINTRTGKQYKLVHEIELEFGLEQMQSRLATAIKTGDLKTRDLIRNRIRTDQLIEVEITTDYKNSDMHTHPHPWMYNAPRNSEFALLDPQNLDLYDLYCCGENVLKLVQDKIIKIGNQPLNRTVPKGMKCYGFKF